MGKYVCKVCDDKVACRVIDEELAKGMTFAALARLMTLRGFDVSAHIVSQHDKHRAPAPPPDVAKRRKDVAILVAEKTAEAIESGTLDITDEKLWRNVGPGLKAQALLDKRESQADTKKLAVRIAVLLAGGSPAGYLAPPELTAGDEAEGVVEGEFTDVSDD